MKQENDINKKRSNNRTPDIVRTNIAIDLGVNGLTPAQCSKKYGLAQQSITRWLRNDPTFVKEVERYKNDAVNEKIGVINRMMLGVIDSQLQNIIDISLDENAPYNTRLNASQFIVNKFVPDAKSLTSIRSQNNTQINIDTNNNKNNIEDILNSFNTLIDNNTETDNTAETDNNIIDIDTNTDITDNN